MTKKRPDITFDMTAVEADLVALCLNVGFLNERHRLRPQHQTKIENLMDRFHLLRMDQ